MEQQENLYGWPRLFQERLITIRPMKRGMCERSNKVPGMRCPGTRACPPVTGRQGSRHAVPKQQGLSSCHGATRFQACGAQAPGPVLLSRGDKVPGMRYPSTRPVLLSRGETTWNRPGKSIMLTVAVDVMLEI
ncbi:hypothetical protein PoB_005872700 [Plakobranchus ocellatus]|uniref:Uncharacterized protein n=1 Tax=Plakobranchus ocellatus TaxID=259542 RepID=A0AAV4CL59_9GAST|nr:hypothetical protein PoB_005872700 [Plakobranchus ocellatus]